MGLLLGLFDPDWTENSYWFVAGVLVGGPLGLVGAAAGRPGPWGLTARLLVPVGAVLEPVYVGVLTMPAVMPWPGRVSSVVGGALLLASGLAGVVAVLAAARSSTRPDTDRLARRPVQQRAPTA